MGRNNGGTMKITIEKRFGNRWAIVLTQGHQSFDLDFKAANKKEAEWFANMFRTALANHDAEVAEKRTSKKDAVYLVECLSGGSWHTWKTANTKEEAQAIIDNRLNRLSICRIMVQSKTPVDGKRNTKGTSRKISRKKAV